MIDIHTHILPQVDDGASSWAVATKMCDLAMADGVTHVVATPHADDTYTYKRDQLRGKLHRLQEIVGQRLKFSLGCDFHLSYDNIQEALDNPAEYTINDTPYLLVEFSDYGMSSYVEEAILRLRSVGVVPIVTHPERNLLMQRHPQSIRRLLDHGCLVQVTASSFLGQWGPSAQKIAEWLLEGDAVHVIASDAHDAERRSPLLSAARQAITRLRGAEVACALVEANPLAIVNGEHIPFAPHPKLKTSRAALR